MENLINGPAGFRPGSLLENTNVLKVFKELPTDAQLAAQLADASKIAAANKAKILDTILQNRLAGLAGSRLGTLLGVGGALIDFVEATGNAVADMYIAQARIMAHEKVEAHRREMERRRNEIANERIRKQNAEIRKQRERDRQEADARRAQEQLQDDLIRNQALAEQRFLEQQRNRRRGGAKSQPGGFNLAQFAQMLAQEEASKEPAVTKRASGEIPPSNPNGLVGFLDYLAEKHGVTTPGGAPGSPNNDNSGGGQNDPCFPNEGKK